MSIQEDNYYLKMAIELATENVENGTGGPFGAVIVKDGEIIAVGQNSVTRSNDPTSHAEIVAIRIATQKLGTFQLDGCTIYSSCEPCPMCLGAIYWSRATRLVFAADKFDASNAGFDDSFIYDEISKTIIQRKLSTKNIKHIDSLKPFISWRKSEGKIEY